MLDSDADRLEIIQSLGGQQITAAGSTFWAIFDNEYLSVGAGPGVETRQPVLACRTSDVSALAMEKEIDVTVAGVPYRIRRHEPDGTGMSVLLLKRT